MDTYRGASGQLYGEHTKSGRHYIYQHVNPSSGKVFYVGLGRFNRCNQITQRNRYWKNYFNKYGLRVEILEKDLTRDEAAIAERKYIKDIKPLCNMTIGGEISYPPTRRVFAFYEDGRLFSEFRSICDANAFFGILPNDSRILRCLNGERQKFKGFLWSEQIDNPPILRKRKCAPSKKVHQYDLEGNYIASYESPRDANVPTRTGIYGTLDKNFTYAGYFWRTEKREKINVKRPKPALVAKKKVLCQRTGIVYDSLQAAALERGIPHQTLSKKLRGIIKNNTEMIFYVQEANNT